MQDKIAQNPQFGNYILFTDEASFSSDGFVNVYNSHIWVKENAQEIAEARHQQKFSVNVWGGIVGDHLIGPSFLPNRLNGTNYRQFQGEELPALLEDVPLQVRQNMYFNT